MPPVPASAEITTVPPATEPWFTAAVSVANSSARPTKAGGAAGNCSGTGRPGEAVWW